MYRSPKSVFLKSDRNNCVAQHCGQQLAKVATLARGLGTWVGTRRLWGLCQPCRSRLVDSASNWQSVPTLHYCLALDRQGMCNSCDVFNALASPRLERTLWVIEGGFLGRFDTVIRVTSELVNSQFGSPKVRWESCHALLPHWILDPQSYWAFAFSELCELVWNTN